ncbi:MAG: hypothetical protein U0229_13895 [Anaeromyxobacter sp.]
MELVKDDVAALPVTGLDGKQIPLGSLWAERPAVVVFLRHFG